jgi:hypothetical protein
MCSLTDLEFVLLLGIAVDYSAGSYMISSLSLTLTPQSILPEAPRGPPPPPPPTPHGARQAVVAVLQLQTTYKCAISVLELECVL